MWYYFPKIARWTGDGERINNYEWPNIGLVNY